MNPLNQFLGAIKVNTDVWKKKKIINSRAVQFSYCYKQLQKELRHLLSRIL